MLDGDALRMPFFGDDFVLLDRARGGPLASLFSPGARPLVWWRPWSQGLHVALLERVFGAHALPFHLANLALWLAALLLFFSLVRRAAGGPAAWRAGAALAVMAAWGTPLLWAAGAQELWMLVGSLAALRLALARRGGAAAAALAVALLSKETAAVVPVIALACVVALGGESWRAVARRVTPMALVTLAWAAIHPLLLGRVWSGAAPPPPADATLAEPAPVVAARAILALLNLDHVPDPIGGWRVPAIAGAVLALAIAALLLRAAGSPARDRAPVARRRVVAAGAAWAAAAWVPLLAPAVGFQAYYGLLGACGAWLAIAAALDPWPRWGIAVVALSAAFAPFQTVTPSPGWGGAWYPRRAGAFVGQLKRSLMRLHPSLAPHTRLYFTGVPAYVGLLAGDGPVARVWYGDPTLEARLFSAYAPRAAGAAPGTDRFFRCLGFEGVREIDPRAPRPPGAGAERAWRADLDELGASFAGGGDWRRAASVFERLARAEPDSVSHAFNAGVCFEAVGDSASAARWYARAARLPGADAEVREQARRFERHLRHGP